MRSVTEEQRRQQPARARPAGLRILVAAAALLVDERSKGYSSFSRLAAASNLPQRTRFLLIRWVLKSRIAFGAGPCVPPMAEINLGYRPCTLTRGPAPKSTQPCLMSQPSSSYVFLRNSRGEVLKKSLEFFHLRRFLTEDNEGD